MSGRLNKLLQPVRHGASEAREVRAYGEIFEEHIGAPRHLLLRQANPGFLGAVHDGVIASRWELLK